MRIGAFREIRRSEEEWAPFMAGLTAAVRRRRRRTLMGWAAAAVLAASLGGALLLGPGMGRRERPLVRADVPTRDEPLFQPQKGLALTPVEGVVIVPREEDHEPA